MIPTGEPKPKQAPPYRTNRAELILAIVATDATFVPARGCPGWEGRCIHCNTRLFVAPDGSTDSTIEHIRPQCDGGGSDPENLALACARCNNEKGVRHDPRVGRGGARGARAGEVIEALLTKRMERWRTPTRGSGDVQHINAGDQQQPTPPGRHGD